MSETEGKTFSALEAYATLLPTLLAKLQVDTTPLRKCLT
jgi:hypothetical protein